MKLSYVFKSYIALVGGGIFLFSSQVQALVTCSLVTARTDTATMTPANISAGPDLPIGTVIYRSTWIENSPANQLLCSTDQQTADTGKVVMNMILSQAPNPLSSWAGTPFGGNVFTTNIPGVGVAIWFANNPVTLTKKVTIGAIDITVPSSASSVQAGYSGRWDFSLIKIGDIAPGSYSFNSASSMPTVQLYYDNMQNVASTNFPITTRTIKFGGTLSISAQTCTTPDVNVNLGSYDQSVLTKNGSTPWINSSIKLTNCPTFRGYYPTENPTSIRGTAQSTTVSTSNQFGLRLNPNSGIIDSTNGIMSVAPASNAATGVGIQVAYGTASSPELFNFSQEKLVTSPKNGSKTITIPLVARYTKTSQTITPGRADGKITFTISYY
ncbi:fimbrial protein [Enterobacter kobei]|uniref:fimbrial protein n=1 Tax=Enterobacter kobei TaxID=208224 RepID=UPI001ABDECC4|nr:fimbrial protein [Enterobacter kobei]MBO4154596.1 fimbrial protein [Enterobacter kobei]UOY68661.1 fimbrial protein [Enterobacter kobei]